MDELNKFQIFSESNCYFKRYNICQGILTITIVFGRVLLFSMIYVKTKQATFCLSKQSGKQIVGPLLQEQFAGSVGQSQWMHPTFQNLVGHVESGPWVHILVIAVHLGGVHVHLVLHGHSGGGVQPVDPVRRVLGQHHAQSRQQHRQ